MAKLKRTVIKGNKGKLPDFLVNETDEQIFNDFLKSTWASYMVAINNKVQSKEKSNHYIGYSKDSGVSYSGIPTKDDGLLYSIAIIITEELN